MDKKKPIFWGVQKIKFDTWYNLCTDTFELFLKNEERGELLLGQRNNVGAKGSPLEWSTLPVESVDLTDDTITWDWYAGGKDREITLLPAMPDRPLVLKPRVKRHILPGCKTKLLFFVPVWIQLYTGSGDKSNLIFQFPSQVLSSTWFGEMQNGELCYALERDLLESRPAVAMSPFSAVCTLNIENGSQFLLDFQRMAVHVEYLSLFTDGHSLYTNEVYVKFNGVDQISQIKYSSRAPKWSGNITKINTSRERPTKNILKKSFYFIKALTDM